MAAAADEPEVELTVLICTYNRARLLARALDRVAAQIVRPGRSWDVLVVDNNCTDDTAAVVRAFVRDARPPALRYLREPRQGVAFARKRGLAEARGRLVAFVDDDCLVAPDWVDQALEFADGHPRAGAFGGRNALLWERPPGRVAELYGASLARQDLGDAPNPMPPVGRTYPVGAGLVLRRQAVLASGWLTSGVLTGRRAHRLTAGEDSELILRIRNSGWEIWYTPRLRLWHVIPEHRTTLPYLRRLHRGFGRCEVFLENLARAPAPTLRVRVHAAVHATRALAQVLGRLPKGFVRYRDERPTWLIRLSHAWGCIEGAVYYLATGRGW